MKEYTLYNYSLFIFLGILVGSVSVLKENDFIGIFFIVLLFFIILVLSNLLKNHYLKYIIMLAYILRCIVLIWGTYVSPLPDSTADAVMFDKTALYISQQLESRDVSTILSRSHFYPKIISIFYYFFGHVQLVAILINVISGTLIVFFVYKLIIELGGSTKSALLGTIISTFFPSLNLYSAILLRDSLITLFFTISIYFLIKWINGRTWAFAMLSTAFLLFTSVFHSAFILVGIVHAFYLLFYDRHSKRLKISFFQFSFSIICIATIFILFKNILLNKLPQNLNLLFSPDYLTERLKSLAVGKSAYLENFYPKSFLDIFWHTFIRIPYFLFSPIFNAEFNLKVLVAIIDVLIYISLFYFVFNGFRYIFTKNKYSSLCLLTILLITITMFAWGTSNYGTALRHRQKIAPILISVSVLCSKKDKEPTC